MGHEHIRPTRTGAWCKRVPTGTAKMEIPVNTANFGASYSGNASSVYFRQPTGFIPGIGYPRQVQLGSRFLF